MKSLIKETQNCRAVGMFMPPSNNRDLLPDFQKEDAFCGYVSKRQMAGDTKSSKTKEIYPQVFNDSLPRIKSHHDEGSKTQSLISKANQKVQLYNHRWYVNGSFGVNKKELVTIWPCTENKK